MFPNPSINLLEKSFSILKNVKWGAILDGTQKTLNVINQAIPIVYQIKPLANNAKTLFKVANIINNPDNSINTAKKEDKATKNSPIFYI